jgi:hypothetical protein
MRGESSSQLGVSVIIPTQQSKHVFDVVKLFICSKAIYCGRKTCRAFYLVAGRDLFGQRKIFLRFFLGR